MHGDRSESAGLLRDRRLDGSDPVQIVTSNLVRSTSPMGSRSGDVTEILASGLRAGDRLFPELSWTDEVGAHTFVLEGRATIGSDEGVDLRVNDPAVSRLHAELELRDDGVWIR